MLLPNGWCDIVSHTTMAANADVYFRGPRVDRASMRHAASQRQPHGTRDGDTSAVPHLNHYASRRSSWTGGLYDPTSGVQTTLNPLFQADPGTNVCHHGVLLSLSAVCHLCKHRWYDKIFRAAVI
eukprot:m.633915 g.633915  ORF g.633915 m.633915 type:complete len:125 (-) comp22581_c0_seq2:2775-3149(-)